jgi:hypothetical protein
LWIAGLIFGGGSARGRPRTAYVQALDFVVAGTGAMSGGTISVLIVQEAALGVGADERRRSSPCSSPPCRGMVGFPLTSLILRKEAARLRDEYRAGNLEAPGRRRGAGGTPQNRASSPPGVSRTLPGTLLRRGSRRGRGPRR